MLKPFETAARQFVDHFSDSARWDAFVPRDGDIVVSTPPKCGTTWTQSILALLISGDPKVDAQISMKSPWIEIVFRDLQEVMARLEAQDHRRQVKSHAPLDCVPIWNELRYITVYRHPIDMHFSFQNHLANMKPEMAGTVKHEDPSASFRHFLQDDEAHSGFACLIDHYLCTLKREPRENLLRLHYRDMIRDLTGAFAQIAAHVGIEHPAELMAQLVEAATFDNMKRNSDRFAPSAGQGFWKSDAGFFNSATSNKWEGKLTDADLQAYDDKISEVLSPKERRWLEWGSI
ncbi:MAG: sulfotransferase domain-containing protein [Aliishimia sp.]